MDPLKIHCGWFLPFLLTNFHITLRVNIWKISLLSGCPKPRGTDCDTFPWISLKTWSWMEGRTSIQDLTIWCWYCIFKNYTDAHPFTSNKHWRWGCNNCEVSDSTRRFSSYLKNKLHRLWGNLQGSMHGHIHYWHTWKNDFWFEGFWGNIYGTPWFFLLSDMGVSFDNFPSTNWKRLTAQFAVAKSVSTERNSFTRSSLWSREENPPFIDDVPTLKPRFICKRWASRGWTPQEESWFHHVSP